MARTPEGRFQDKLVADVKAMFPGCLVLKNDANTRQGIPDLLILFRDRWAMLEVKKSDKEKPRPNQPWYVRFAQENSFGAFIFPENRDEVLRELTSFFD